ncbi:uridine kinase [Pelagibacterium limicola]|uniref:uridine kinase n=1 Tax=Pelagibacterium limicola TaxID=2791022 RepID=UPI0018B0009E|nr:uridine kinase [Pelagibacterium limicola]
MREALLLRIAQVVLALPSRAVVAVDGVDGSGKTMLADELATALQLAGRETVRASVDGFHNPRAVRYARGKSDPLGFFLDSYNYESLRRHLIDPFRRGAPSVDIARFDHRTDSAEPVTVSDIGANAVLILDGIFLHRDELAQLWDYSLFLAVPFEISYQRMAARDGSDPDPEAADNRRYLEGQKLYLATCEPRERASLVVDNSDLAAPFIIGSSAL